MADRLYTSQKADEYINGLRMESKLDKATLTRMAFTVSLVNSGMEVSSSTNFSGGELKRPTFFKDDEGFIQTLVAFVYGGNTFSEDEFYSNKSIIKNHIDDGARILWDLFEAQGQDVSRWYSSLIEKIELKGAKEKLTKDLDIFIGRNILTNEPLMMELNNTQKHANSHLAIIDSIYGHDGFLIEFEQVSALIYTHFKKQILSTETNK